LNNVINNNENNEKIIMNSRELVLNNLLPEHVYCYHLNLFEKYSKLLKNKVELRPEMTPVFDETNRCNCRTKTNYREEL